MSKKSLILYASWGGNTEKVAMKFKSVFDKYGWQCDTLKCTKHTDVHNPPYLVDDYDILCLGSLIVNGLPVKEIFDDHLGIAMPQNLFRGHKWGFGTITEGYRPIKGIAFVTYGGTRWGPPEAIPSLDMLALRMEDMRIKCIGKFACAGGHKGAHGFSLDKLANKKGWTIEDASSIVNRYMGNPDDDEFKQLSKEDLELLISTVEARKKELNKPGADRLHSWHYDVANRPSERDLLKAEIFLEEILEDYYGDGVEAAPMAQYICIA